MTTALLDRKQQQAVRLGAQRWTLVDAERSGFVTDSEWRTIEPAPATPAEARLEALRIQAAARIADLGWDEDTDEERADAHATVLALRPLQARTFDADC